MKILGLDPGKTTGWALLENSTPLKIGEWKESEFEEELIKLTDEEDIDVLVIEDFVFRPGFKEGKWKTTEVPKLIGCARVVARIKNIEFVEQAPAIKPIGYGMAKLKYVKGKRGMHKFDAVAHATYWWRTVGCKRKGSSGPRENQAQA